MPHLSPLVWGFMLWLVVFFCIVVIVLTYWSGPVKFGFGGIDGCYKGVRWDWRYPKWLRLSERL